MAILLPTLQAASSTSMGTVSSACSFVISQRVGQEGDSLCWINMKSSLESVRPRQPAFLSKFYLLFKAQLKASSSRKSSPPSSALDNCHINYVYSSTS